jgi:hypothetical protein
VDGKPLALAVAQSDPGFVLCAPAGEHVLIIAP